jgi:hypothetical protein
MKIQGRSIIGFNSAHQSDTSIKAIDPSTGSEIEPPFYKRSADF